MKRNKASLIIFLLASILVLAACSSKESGSEKESPISIEEIVGSDFKRLELTEKAFERLGIQTTQLVEQQVTRQRLVGGEIIDPAMVPTTGGSPSMSPDTYLVRVRLNSSDLARVDRSQPAQVLPLDDDEPGDVDSDGLEADEVDGFEGEDDGDEDAADGSLYYTINNSKAMSIGQRVRVGVSLVGSGSVVKVVPYAAIIYGLHGETWVYTNPEPLVYVRQPIVIDYIEGDVAVLTEGPEAGTNVVTVGAAELFGAESGVGGGH